jgi:zeta-carotene desaturase
MTDASRSPTPSDASHAGALMLPPVFEASALGRPPRVIVVGGGLAGMACSLALEQAGSQVTLLESRHALGGRASSYADPGAPDEALENAGGLLDNSQHVLLGCCVNLLDFYRRAGVADAVHWHRTVPFLDTSSPPQRHDLRGAAWLPAPLHMSVAMARFGLLTLSERFAVTRAMLAMLRLGRAGREALDELSFGYWLAQHNQPPALVRKFYEPVLISALNIPCIKASAKYAIQVFQEALLANRAGYVMGLADRPLEQLYAHVPLADLRLSTRVSELLWDGRRVCGVKLLDGTELRADAVVLASNFHAVGRWVAGLPVAATRPDERLQGLATLQSVPILGVQMWFDRPILSEPALALTEPPEDPRGRSAPESAAGLQWLFRKDAEGKVVAGVISAATAWVNVPREEALARFAKQIQRSGLGGKPAPQLLRGSTVIERRATFAPFPGMDKARPLPAPGTVGVRGMYLAGDYTRTGWPATMEGAVRSGYLAAEALLADAGLPATARKFMVDDLPTEWPARWLGLK